MQLLGISGSLRRDSYNRRLLVCAAELAPPDVELSIWDALKEVPPYSEDDDVDFQAVSRSTAASPPAIRRPQ